MSDYGLGPKPSFIGCRDYQDIWRDWSGEGEDERLEDEIQQLQSADPAEDQQYLRSLPYWLYLRSTHWYILRRLSLYRANYECQHCGTNRRRLDVHHRTYERLGGEADGDLVVLCSVCHLKEHGGDDFAVVAQALGEESAVFIANKDGLKELARLAAAYRRAGTAGPRSP